MMGPTQAPRVLIIDDEPSIRNVIKVSLQSQGFEVEEAESGKSGLMIIDSFHPHLIILDLGLPDMSGQDVLKKIRSWTEIPVIVLTVQDSEQTKVDLLDAGADDYLTKPFGVRELLARVRVSLRHRSLIEATPIFQSGDLYVNLNDQTIFVRHQPVKLTSTEFQLLAHLIRNQNKVVSQHQLLESVWGPQGKDQGHYLRIYIGQLRKKLEVDPSHPKHIITEPGVGYRII